MGECGGGKAQVRCLIVVEVGSNLFVWPYAVEDRLRPPGGQAPAIPKVANYSVVLHSL
jgi:hypothetical protein